jgi:hypothetical protein
MPLIEISPKFFINPYRADSIRILEEESKGESLGTGIPRAVVTWSTGPVVYEGSGVETLVYWLEKQSVRKPNPKPKPPKHYKLVRIENGPDWGI